MSQSLKVGQTACDCDSCADSAVQPMSTHTGDIVQAFLPDDARERWQDSQARAARARAAEYPPRTNTLTAKRVIERAST